MQWFRFISLSYSALLTLYQNDNSPKTIAKVKKYLFVKPAGSVEDFVSRMKRGWLGMMKSVAGDVIKEESIHPLLSGTKRYIETK